MKIASVVSVRPFTLVEFNIGSGIDISLRELRRITEPFNIGGNDFEAVLQDGVKAAIALIEFIAKTNKAGLSAAAQ